MTDRRPITEDDLHAYVDAVLDPTRRTEIDEYLDAHPDVAARVQGYARQRADLRAALGPIAEEPVPPELNLARMVETRRRATVGWWRAAAAVLLLCLGAAGGWSLHGAVSLSSAPGLSGIQALAQEAAYSYAVYAPDHTRPVEIRATERAELVNWASERLHHPVAVPDLSASSYRFMGGRVVPTSHGPAILFMYDNDHGTRLVLLSRRMEVDQTARMTPHSQGDVDGFTWADDGIGYSLVGPLPSTTLHPLADEVRRQEQGI
jgi:anti-sigma factor RsiW